MSHAVFPCCCQMSPCCKQCCSCPPSQNCDAAACCPLTFDKVMFAAGCTSPSSTPCGTNRCPCPSIMRSPRIIAQNCAKFGSTCQDSVCCCSGYCC